MKKKTWIIIIAAAVIAAAIGGALMLGDLIGPYAGIRKEALLSYRAGSGGDMQGSSHQLYVDAYDETHARITTEDAEWHYEDPVAREYLTDIAVLQEIREIFLKYRMQNWNGRKFTDLFVADGASYSYSFDFEKSDVSFSSQVYPKKYSEKLDEIDAVVEKYLAKAEELPGLVLPERTEEEKHVAWHPNDGLTTVTVIRYSRNRLHYRLSNGTDTDMTQPTAYSLRRAGSDTPVAEAAEKAYTSTLYAHSVDEESIELPARLPEGQYTLQVGDLTCSFTIGRSD